MFFFIPEIYDEQEVLRKYFSNAAKLIWFAIFFFFISQAEISITMHSHLPPRRYLIIYEIRNSFKTTKHEGKLFFRERYSSILVIP